jgi:hypothetical protein
MPYEPFRKNYVRTQQPPLPGSEREYIDQELRKLQEALREIVEQIKALQALVPNP